jgi:hypothetical protein
MAVGVIELQRVLIRREGQLTANRGAWLLSSFSVSNLILKSESKSERSLAVCMCTIHVPAHSRFPWGCHPI